MAARDVDPRHALSHTGGCHCGGLRWTFDTARPLATFSPRACDCDFCSRHHAAWVSDPAGRLRIDVVKPALRRFRQGSGQAEFLFCGTCGCLVGVVAQDGSGRWIGAANRNAFDAAADLGDQTVVSPKQLTADAKRERWRDVWMSAELDPGD